MVRNETEAVGGGNDRKVQIQVGNHGTEVEPIPSKAACTLLFKAWFLTAETDPGPAAVDGGFVRLI
jgi:hypothetical protein